MSSRRWRPHRPGRCVRGRCPSEARQSCERLNSPSPEPSSVRPASARANRTHARGRESSGKAGAVAGDVQLDGLVAFHGDELHTRAGGAARSPPGCRGPGRSGTSARRKASCSSSARASVIRSATIRASRRSPPPPSRSPSAAPPGPAAPERLSSSSVLGRKRASKLTAGVGDAPALALPATRSARASRGLTPVPAHTLASRSRRTFQRFAARVAAGSPA